MNWQNSTQMKIKPPQTIICTWSSFSSRYRWRDKKKTKYKKCFLSATLKTPLTKDPLSQQTVEWIWLKNEHNYCTKMVAIVQTHGYCVSKIDLMLISVVSHFNVNARVFPSYSFDIVPGSRPFDWNKKNKCQIKLNLYNRSSKQQWQWVSVTTCWHGN